MVRTGCSGATTVSSTVTTAGVNNVGTSSTSGTSTITSSGYQNELLGTNNSSSSNSSNSSSQQITSTHQLGGNHHDNNVDMEMTAQEKLIEYEKASTPTDVRDVHF